MNELTIRIPPSLMAELTERVMPYEDEDEIDDPDEFTNFNRLAALLAELGQPDRGVDVSLPRDLAELLHRECINIYSVLNGEPIARTAVTVADQIERLLEGLPRRVVRVPPRLSGHPDSVKQEAERVVRETVEACRRILLRKNSDMALPRGWRPKIKISWHLSRSRSHGGHDGISMALVRYVPVDGQGGAVFREYNRWNANPAIGGFETNDWRNAVRAVTAHEVAHAAQHDMRRIGRHRKIDYETAHGDGWRQIYALLRREVVNPHL